MYRKQCVYSNYSKNKVLGANDKAQVFFLDVLVPNEIIEYATIKKTTVTLESQQITQSTTCCNQAHSSVLITGRFEIEIQVKTWDKEGELTLSTPFYQLIELDEVYNGPFEVKTTIESENIVQAQGVIRGWHINLAWQTCVVSA